MSKRVTILDVAAEAGVSRQTVTRAMNDMADISDATRDRVLEASARLGYRPSRFARNLVTRQKTRAVGLLTPSLRNPYFTELADAMLAEAESRGWQLIIAATRGGDDQRSFQLLESQVDVIVGHFAVLPTVIAQWAPGLPVVTLETESGQPGVHSVDIDIRGGVHAAVSALRARGATTLAMIDSAYASVAAGAYLPTPRRGYFEEALGAEEVRVVHAEETISGGAAAFSELVSRYPDVDAVLAFNDLMAIGAVQAARNAQIEVPARVRILGIDGLSLGEAVDPPLSTLTLNHAAIATGAMDIVDELARAHFTRLAPIHREVSPTLLWRASA